MAINWTGTRWFAEGDIKGCFDNIDHEVLLSGLGEKLHGNRFLRLLKHLLKAGYMEDWKYGRTLSGTPQGGVVSPILANIYLDRLDQFVETVLIPAYTRGAVRKRNPEWAALRRQMATQRDLGNHQLAETLRRKMQQLPSGDPQDPGCRRLRYVRYADDFVLGFIGPKAEAEAIKESLATFLRDTLKLELSREKTLITHATSQAAKFLGYELVTQQVNDKLDRNRQRNVNGRIGLRVPVKVIEQHCQAYMENGEPAYRSRLIHDTDYTIVDRYQAEFRGVVQYYLLNGRIGLRVPVKVIEQHCQAYMENGEPAYRSRLIHDTDYTIVDRYQAEFRGVVQYYLLAQNVSHLGKLRWVMEWSLAKTLAAKHKTTCRQVFRSYKSTVETEHGPRKCLKVVEQQGNGKRPLVTQFGGIPLKRKRQAILKDQLPTRYRSERTELIQRLLADTCEMCGSTVDVQVHYVRALRDLNVKGQGQKRP